MSHIEIVRAFVQVLLENPEMTATACLHELKGTDYEVKILKADPLKKYHGEFSLETDLPNKPHLYQIPENQGTLFPLEVAEAHHIA